MNEHETIIFSDHKIYCIPDNESDTDNDSDIYDELEDLLEQEDDIYSDDHPWDTRVYQYRFRPDVVFSNFFF